MVFAAVLVAHFRDKWVHVFTASTDVRLKRCLCTSENPCRCTNACLSVVATLLLLNVLERKVSYLLPRDRILKDIFLVRFFD